MWIHWQRCNESSRGRWTSSLQAGVAVHGFHQVASQGKDWLHIPPTLGPQELMSTSPWILAPSQVMRKMLQLMPELLLTHGIGNAMFLGCKNSCRHAGMWAASAAILLLCQLTACATSFTGQKWEQSEHGLMLGSPQALYSPPFLKLEWEMSWRPSVFFPHP